MNVLMVGADSRGSWQMRGVQLGAAMGARVTLKPTANDWAWADVVVLVKRAAMVFSKEARACKVPVVWDALDFWQQPEENSKPLQEHIGTALQIARDANVSRIVCATQAMASDLGGVYLTHHCREGLKPTPIRDRAMVVGYDGTKKYLGRWLPALEKACADLGLNFGINPKNLPFCDVLVSFRDGKWDGEVCRRWKSGVKFVNAVVAGRPILSQPSAALDEIKPFGLTVDAPEHLGQALARVVDVPTRCLARTDSDFMASGFTVQAVARKYLDILAPIAERRAA